MLVGASIMLINAPDIPEIHPIISIRPSVVSTTPGALSERGQQPDSRPEARDKPAQSGHDLRKILKMPKPVFGGYAPGRSESFNTSCTIF